MGYGKSQLLVELATFALGRVTNVRCSGTNHFYGFARCVDTGRTMWFTRLSRVRGTVWMGPVELGGCEDDVDAPPPSRGSLVVGTVIDAAKGPAYSWWMSRDTGAIAAFMHVVRARRPMRANDASLRSAMNLTGGVTPDALWELARLLVNADVSSVGDAIMATETVTVGGMSPERFAWHAAEFVRDTGILDGVAAYLTSHGYTGRVDLCRDELLAALKVPAVNSGEHKL